ncbi:hypothetical protein AVEN_111082-1 [Araneus ventricosus]|uniref:Endonuclease/exonuclease/phosphatase domain-containing protein n=1 Tax=Araneus ventricosus TaxID=182803 RepID=A0A4Y2DP18_ARAVE|nr:hypothetical protein AVEN_111082-1 [Araneus ventricosus]
MRTSAGLSYSRIEITKDSRTKCLGRVHESRDEVLASHCNPPRAVYSYHRASGGIVILAATNIPTIPVTLNTNLQAVAIRIQTHSLIIVCSLYLPPSERVSQTDLNNLIHQLPSPFIILGDLNGHSSFWGSSDSNSRGLQIEQFIADHNLCLLNSDEKTHFHLPTRTFYSVNLSISSPPLLPFLSLTVDNDLYNSDHFPLILTDSRHNPTSHFRPPKYIFNAANWQKFTSLANINSDIIKSSTIDQAIDYVVNVIIEAADNSIPKTSDKEQDSTLKLGKNSSRQVSNSVINTSHTTVTNESTKSRVHSVETELLPMAVLPPLGKRILQSRESDADAEMSSFSASEGDTLEYGMSEDLEDAPENVCPTTLPPPSTAQKR